MKTTLISSFCLMAMVMTIYGSNTKFHDELLNPDTPSRLYQEVDYHSMQRPKQVSKDDTERHLVNGIPIIRKAKKANNETTAEIWVNSFQYETTNAGEVRLTYAYPDNDTLFVPEKISHNGQEYTVTEIGGADITISNNTSLVKVVLPESVKRINAYAFYNLQKLISINLPGNLESIGKSAFDRCFLLQNITLPSQLKEIGSFAFYNCSSLNNVTFHASLTKLGTGAFRFCNSITEFIVPAGLTSIEPAAFADCRNLAGIMVSNSNPNYSSLNGVMYDKQMKTLITYPNKASISSTFTIPESVETIESRAFSNTDIESVVLPSNLIGINNLAFTKCNNLGSINIPASTQIITANPFANSKKLTQITVNHNNTSFESVNGLLYTKNRQILIAVPLMFEGTLTVDAATTEIGIDAMCYSEKITQINLPTNLQKIGYGSIYNCIGLSSIVIPNSVTTIDAWAFGWNLNLQTVQMPESLSLLGNYAFYNCPKLTSIQLPNSLTTLPNDCFGWNTSLKNVQLPSGLKSIGYDCFYNCTSLSAIQLPASLTSIMSSAFQLSGLTEIVIPNTVLSINDWVFESCANLTKVTLPQGLTRIGYSAFNFCSSLEEINIPAQLNYIDSYAFNGCVRLPGVTLPSTLNSIGSYAFNNCLSLAFVNNLENTSIDEIDQYTFANCKKLQTIKLPNTVEVIGGYAFDGDSLLSQVQLSNRLISINDRAFRFCAALKSITLPETLTYIYDRAFLGSGLESITLPKSLEYLGNAVFLRCYSMLDFHVDKDNQRFSDIDGVLFNKNATELIHYPIARDNNSYTLPETVSTLAFGACYQAESLISVVLPKLLTQINEYAFWQCISLRKVAIKNNNTPTIHSSVFEYVPLDMCILEVPVGAKQTYQNHEVWGRFNAINEVNFVSNLITGTFTDSRDGNEYKWVKIGDQIWMAENLRYLPSVHSNSQFYNQALNKLPGYGVYDYDGTDVNTAKTSENYTTYGVLYNWYATVQSGAHAIAPIGWRVPTDTEWTQLIVYLGGPYDAYAKMKSTGTTYWKSPNDIATNISGFTALPGGGRNQSFIEKGTIAIWWSSTAEDLEGESAYSRGMSSTSSVVGRGGDYMGNGFSVRCVRDIDSGISNLNSNSKICLQTFPNPVTDMLHIDLTNNDAAGTISILSPEGKVLISQATSGKDLVTLQLQHLPKGIYLCRYANQMENITAKIVKQ